MRPSCGSTATSRRSSRSSGCSRSTTCVPRWAPRRPAESSRSPPRRRGIPVCFHTPSEVKAAVTGNGTADKAQVTAMVTRILELAAAPKPADAADALALAICHCWRAPMMERMARAEAAAAEQKRTYQARLAESARRQVHDDRVGSRRGARDRPRPCGDRSRRVSATGVNATPATLGALHRGAEARLFTAMIVREDSMTLFGFADTESQGPVRAACRRCPGSDRGWRWPCSRCSNPTRCGRRSPRATSRR